MHVLVFGKTIHETSFDYYYEQYMVRFEDGDALTEHYLDSCMLKAEYLKSDYYSAKACYARYLYMQNDSGLFYLQKSLDLLDDYADSAFYANVNFTYARVAIFNDNFIDAVIGINRSLQAISDNFEHYYIEIGDEIYLLESKCLASLGVVYDRFGDYELSLSYFNKALKSINTLNSIDAKRFRSTLVSNISYAYCNLKDYERAEYYSTRAIDLKDGLTGSKSKAFNYRVLAMIAYGEQNYNLALRYLKKADEENRNGNLDIKDQNTFWRGKVQLANGNCRLALAAFKQIENPFKERFTLNDQADLFEMVAKAYNCINDHKNCQFYYQKALDCRRAGVNSERPAHV